ncbi:MAG: AraC family transcriptional regulator [Anaerolineae bacterium]|nr:AraC family transcriptional regulator [Anaerolineae bacterium]
MQEISINTTIDYPRTARTVLSGREKSLIKTFERIRSDKNLSNVVRVKDAANVLSCVRINLEPDEGTGYWEFIQLDKDLYIIATDCQYKKTHAEMVLGEDFLEFHFKISGELLMELNTSEKISIRGPSLLIWKQPAGKDVHEWITGGVRESSFTLYCKPGLFTEKLGIQPEQLPHIVKSFVEGTNQSIEFDILPLNPALAFSITNLLRSCFKDKFHVVHTKAKSYDLLCDVLQYLCSPNLYSKDDPKPLSSYEKMRLQEARDILASTFNPPQTIKSLAKKIGLNETKFKRGFKKLFGTTIHEYGNYHRMQKALELLQTSEMSILGIAQMVGYGYQTSFTAAVKQFFGVTPKQLRDNAMRK